MCKFYVNSLGRVGQNQGRKQSPISGHPRARRPSHPTSTKSQRVLAPFPGRSSSLGPYLIVDRPVPGFGCEFIVLGFEAIVSLQGSGKES